MRITFSLFVCSFALFFSTNAVGYNFDADSKYASCKNTHGLAKCANIPLINRKAYMDSFLSCPLTNAQYTDISTFLTNNQCGSGTEISRSCIERVHGNISQRISAACKSYNTSMNATSPGAVTPGMAQPTSGTSVPTAGTPAAEPTGPGGLEIAGAITQSIAGALEKKDAAAAAMQRPQPTTTATPSGQPIQNNISKNIQNTNETFEQGKARLAAERPKVGDVTPTGQRMAAEEKALKSSGVVSESATSPTQAAVDPYEVDGANMGPIDGAKVAQETTQAQAEIAADINKASESLPSMSDEFKKVGEVSKSPESLAEGVKGDSAAAAAQVDQNTLMVVTTNANSAQTIENFQATAAAFQNLSTQVTQYINVTKKLCVVKGDMTTFLCLEGTSPGIQAAKVAVDVAGPAIALINSAQKSCSSTADMTRAIGTGLTIAKGACTLTKLACDMSCSKAQADLGKISATMQQIPAAIQADAAKDFGICMGECGGFPYCTAPCKAQATAKASAAQSMYGQSLTAIQKEAPPTPGTPAGVALKCQGHMKDIALMALNVIGMLQANKSAKACAEKLASAGTATSPAQYCAQPANASTTYCKCQKDTTAQGCPGAIATNSLNSNGSSFGDTGAGLNLNGKSGASQFAGPGLNGKIGAGAIDPKTGLPVSDSASASGSGSDANKSGALGGAGSGSASGSGGGAGSADSDSAGSANAADKKKWSFGAFANSLGLGGFGGNGKGFSGANNMPGKFNASEVAARAIASEKLRAEISGASGKSNWEKVRERYLRNSSTLMER